MTTKLFTDRSRYEDGLRCARLRWYGYHAAAGDARLGLRSAKTPLPLAVGGSVHEGLAELLRLSMQHSTGMLAEDQAVAVALADFAQYKNQIDAPDAEQAAMAPSGPGTLAAQLMDSLGQDSAGERAASFTSAKARFDEYLYREQSALVEALVRAYARRRLRPLLEQFEALEVEREGEWLLSEWEFNDNHPDGTLPAQLWFMSRLDALLRERSSDALFLLSYKTTGAWDDRKARDAEHDMQGMSEGIEVERRLAEWYATVQRAFGNPSYVDSYWGPDAAGRQVDAAQRFCDANIPLAMREYLKKLDAPPRILGVRYEYLLKGERWKDKELTAQFGMEMRSQRSHLIRRYVATSTPQRGQAAYAIGDECWSWDYVKDDGSAGSLAWQNWKSRPVWEVMANGAPIVGGVRDWIDRLDEAAETMSAEDPTAGLEPRLLGYGCDAQAMGVTREHPLDAAFVPPIVVYRNEDELRDLVDQMEAVERRVQEGAAAVHAAGDEGERRHALNVHFPMTRRACFYPSECAFTKLCFGGEDIRHEPLQSGLYKIRVPNHPQERSVEAGAGDSEL